MNDDRLKRALGAIGDAAPPAPDWDVVTHRLVDRPSRRSVVAGRVLALAAVLVVVAGVAVALTDREDPGRRLVVVDSAPDTSSTSSPVTSASSTTTGDTQEPMSSGWTQLPDPPLSPRHSSVVARVGDEIVVVGGTNHLCPPGADCSIQPRDEVFADGAAYDLATGRWRTIADAPRGMFGYEGVVLDDALWLGIEDHSTGEPLMDVWGYTPVTDRWDVIRAETVGRLVVAADTLVVVSGSDERESRPDQILDRTTGTWTDLPDDPLGPSFDRTMVGVDDSLYLFAKDLVPNPGSGSTPSVARAARLDLTTMTWTVLPDSEILTTGPWLVAGELLVNPSLGCADGGGNEYGRCYPMGGIFDTATNTWSDLPPIAGFGREPYGEDGVVVSPSAAVSAATYGLDRGFWVLDTDGLDTDRGPWTKVMWPGDGVPGRLEVAGRDLSIAGGERWDVDDGRLLDDVWIWRAP